MKKHNIIYIIILVGLLLLAGCSRQEGEETLRIVTTTFPLYDWTRNIVGEVSDVELTILQDTGVDLHSYQPTAEDIVKIARCDIFIFVGGESDEWVEEVLKSTKNTKMVQIDLLELLGEDALEEEEKEGMETEEEDEEEGPEMDEHVWLSPKNAIFFTEKIRDALVKAAPDRENQFKKNAEAYIKELNQLDQDFRAAAGGAARRTLVFGDRFPFRYLLEELGLDYYAAFAGCSAETEASFETIVFLAGKVDELGLDHILITETGDGRIAEAVKNASQARDQKILVMNSLQSVTRDKIAAGASYIALMRENLAVLKTAMGSQK